MYLAYHQIKLTPHGKGEKTFIAWNWTKLFHFGKGFDVVRVPNLYFVQYFGTIHIVYNTVGELD